MILGIGFIMVAAMFPVAIQQTQTTNEEAFGAALGRTGYSYLEKIANTQFSPVTGAVPSTQTQSILVATFGPTPPMPPAPSNPSQTVMTLAGQMWSFHDPRMWQQAWMPNGSKLAIREILWPTLARNLIIPADPRHAWVALYKRDILVPVINGFADTNPNDWKPAPYAQVVMISVEVRNNNAYTNADLQPVPPTPTGTATLEPFLIAPPSPNLPPAYATGAAQIYRLGNSLNASWVIKFPAISGVRVGEGTFVVISNDGVAGAFNGRILRVGNVSTSDPNPSAPTIWDLAPGYELNQQDAAMLPANGMRNASVFVIGRGQDPSSPGLFTGLAQDTTVYTSFVPVN